MNECTFFRINPKFGMLFLFFNFTRKNVHSCTKNIIQYKLFNFQQNLIITKFISQKANFFSIKIRQMKKNLVHEMHVLTLFPIIAIFLYSIFYSLINRK